jgi:Restriction Endonuclease associating with ARP
MINDRLNPLSRPAETPGTRAGRPLGRGAAITALRRRFAALRPDLEVSPSGYVSRVEDNLLPGVEARQFVEDLPAGNGRELESKFLAIHSSAALAVNTFARFKDEPAHLSLVGVTGFEALDFEFRCPTGLRGGRPAHLDLLAQGRAGVVAVESKCTEHLEPKAPRFSPAYAEQIDDQRRAGPWYRAMAAIVAGTETFTLLDAAQLIKHAFGLARCFRQQPVRLLYLYWEPLDGDRLPMILSHRAELARFSRLVAGGQPTFGAQSHPELWEAWRAASRPSWLRHHVGNLRARYGVALGEGAQA